MPVNPQKKRRYPFKKNLKRKIRRIIFMLVAALLATGINYYNKLNSVDKGVEKSSTRQSSATHFSEEEQQSAIKKIRAAKDNTNAQFWLGIDAKVIKILKDDLSGSRHQKFLVSPVSDITLLVAHNIDLASRVPIKKGDIISVYGRYEWNNRGGVIHWTHHDPKGNNKGGWIRSNGKEYR